MGSAKIPSAKKAKRVLIGGIATGLLIAAIALTFFFPAKTESIDQSSIAILPFENLNADPSSDFFVLGIHRDLLTQLSKIKDLKVISLTSVRQYANTHKSIPEIASELGVTTVLEGGVQRVNGRVRVNVNLISAQTDEQLWASCFDRRLTLENIFEIQADIAQKIAASLESELSPEEQQQIELRHTSNLEAYELYQRGRFHWERLTPEDLRRAVKYFREALKHDGEFATAYAGIADAYLSMEFIAAMPVDEAVRQARIATEQALMLDPDLGESRSALGHVYIHEMNGPGAEREWRRAIELNPNYVEPRFFLAMSLLDWGRVDEAKEHTRKGLELDPLSPITIWAEALRRMARVEHAQAVQQYLKILESAPNLWIGHYELAWVYPGLGEYEAAIEAIKKAQENSPEELIRFHGMRPLIAALHAANGQKPKARQLLRDLDQSQERPFFMGLAQAALGETDRAFELWLHETRWSILVPTHFRYSPLLDEVRSDPRYHEILKTIDRQWGW